MNLAKFTAFTFIPMLCLAKPFEYPFSSEGFHGIVRVSSEWKEAGRVYRGINLLDGSPATSWLPDTSDKNPTIQIIFQRKTSISGLALEFGWRETQSRFLMSLPYGDEYELVRFIENGGKDTVRLTPISESKSSVCHPEIPIDGTFQKRMSRLDIIPHSTNADTLTILTRNILSEIRILGNDTRSDWLNPKEVRDLLEKNLWSSRKPFPVEDICKLKDSSYGCSISLFSRKSVGPCSPELRVKTHG